MSGDYFPIKNTNTGTVHACTELEIHDESYFSTGCGKPVDPWSSDWNANEVQGADITCKTCRATLKASKQYRISRGLVDVCEGLIEDMKARPGAYLHADHSLLDRIEQICLRSHTDLAI